MSDVVSKRAAQHVHSLRLDLLFFQLLPGPCWPGSSPGTSAKGTGPKRMWDDMGPLWVCIKNRKTSQFDPEKKGNSPKKPLVGPVAGPY